MACSHSNGCSFETLRVHGPKKVAFVWPCAGCVIRMIGQIASLWQSSIGMLCTTPSCATSAGNMWSSELGSLVGVAEELRFTSIQSTQCLPVKPSDSMAWLGLAECPLRPPSIHPNTDTNIGEAHRLASGRKSRWASWRRP